MSTTDGNKDAIDTLRALYSQVLGIAIEEVDANLSFVALGGDSFRAVVLFQRCLEKRLQISYHAILSQTLIENAALANETQETLDSVDSTSADRHEVFQLMPKDYDFAKIDELLKKHHGLGVEDVEDIYPCSLMQENMYIGQKMGGGSLYQTTSVYRVSSSYTLDRIRNAWQQVIDRHQTLRTIYVETSDSSSGRLLDAVVLAKMAGNVVAGTSDERDAILAGSPTHESQVGRGTCHQVIVFPETVLEADTRLVKLTLDHITVDATSMIVVVEELGQALQGLLSLKSPPTGYGKYIEYLQRHTDENRALDYWIEYLDGVRSCQFPALNEIGKNQAGSSEIIEVPVEISLAQLRQFCHNSRITVATAVQAAWAQVLHIYTNEPDVCFGYLCSGRGLPIPGVTSVVGPMMNLMVCCIRNIGNKLLQELVDTIRDDFNTALPHQSFSLRNVQRILGNSESKLFNTIVNTFYGPSRLADDSEQIIKHVSSHNASDLDIVVKALYTDIDFKVRLAYSSTILSASMAKHVAHTFGSILDRMVTVADGPSCKVSNMVTASPYDTQSISTWNEQTASPTDIQPACVHELIQLTARKYPSQPAVHAWDGHMDYETFDKASTVLAQWIGRQGIGTKKYIPLCFGKSKWYSVALLAVMKSGNAFVPLDLSNPDQRMRKIIDQLGNTDQGKSLIICSRKLEERCVSLSRNTIVLDQELLQDLLLIDPIDTSLPTAKLSDPAYVIYTSGSTGEPKGVVIEHGAYSHAARTHGPNLHISRGSRVLQFASYGFDTSMEDHLTTFILGGCLCVPSEEDRLSIPGLAAFALQSEANWAHITPSFAELLTRREFPTIKTMVLGGEPMTFGNIWEWAKPGESRLIQVYGPSECCVTTTVNSDVNIDSVPTNIGNALPGCATWITRPEDPHELCPVGAVGELLVEGPILARGYLDDPEKTSAAFVRDLKFAPGRRMYRTGDLAKYDSKGRLHFVGRRDGQVKVHGQRIELGEIERQLLLDSQVQNALALAPRSGPCAHKLVAVLSPTSFADKAEEKPATQSSAFNLVDGSWCTLISGTKTFLEERLPAYMVPELWLVLREIPRNSSAKLDRKRVMRYLEDLSSDQYSLIISRMEEQGIERSGTVYEVELRDLWAEVLNIPADEIQWSSSFFSLGGDSISAMTVASLAVQQGFSFSGADILRHRNIQRLAKTLAVPSQKFSHAGEAVEEETRDAGLDESPFPLSPIQRLHFQISDGMGDPFDQQTVLLRVRSRIAEDALISAFEALLVAHPMLRARFIRNEDEPCSQDPWVQRIAPAAEARSSRGTRLRFHSWARDDYIVDSITEAKAAINVVKGPLVAADLFQGEDRTLLSVTIHHLSIDTVSWRILLQDLERHLRGEAIVVRETTSFQAWSLAQRQFVASLPPRSANPETSSDLSRSFWAVDQAQNTFGAVETQSIKLDKRVVGHLQSLCESTTYQLIDLLSFVIVSSFSETFSRMPQLFLEGHGREDFSPAHDPSNTVGWFTTFSPLQLSSSKIELGDLSRGLAEIRESRKSMPLNGFSHFTSAMLNDSGGADYLPMEIVLNHLGRFQQVEKSGSMFQRYDGDIQNTLSKLRRRQRSTCRRYALIGVLSRMQDEDLVLEVEWSKCMLHQERIRDWISRLETGFHQSAGESPQDLSQGHQSLDIFGMSREKGYDHIKSRCQSLGIELSNVEAAYPCSPIQESLMLSQLRQPNGVYSQHFLFRVLSSANETQNPDFKRLENAWKSVVAKHSILRTIFSQDDSGLFLQIVLRHIDPDIQYLMLEDEKELPEIWANECNLPGNSPLSGKIMHCLKIYTTPSGSVYCMLNKNHLITDGFSSRLLLKDFIVAYDGCIEADTIPYANYIDYVCQQDLEATTLYWENYLNAVTPCTLTWPKSEVGDEARTMGLTFEKAEAILREGKIINLAAQKMDLTSPVVFKAAWAWLLKTYLNSDDVVFGILSSGRDIKVQGAQRIVGPMATMLPIRARIRPGTTAIELCRRIQEDDLEHISRQTVSLAKIQHSIKQSDGPLFNTILNIQKSPGVPLQKNSGSLKFELLHACDTSEYDLALSITEENGTFKLSMEYPTYFISHCEAANLLDVFQKAVLRIISVPNVALDTESIATASDKGRIRKWNSQSWDKENRLVHHIIRDTVTKQPSRPAIWSWDGQLTYSELDFMSTRLAKQLLAIGCRTGSIVVLCFDKSLWAVVSMLAVAKAGAGFVHVDPKGPAERTKSIIQQTQSMLSLCSAGNEPRISSFVQTTMTVNQSAIDRFPVPEQENLNLPVGDLSDVLYIIFTSGSTGEPKGVVIQHRSFCSAAKHNRSWLQIEKDSRVLQFTSYCFDASLEEIFTVLIAGGCICIPSEHDRLTDIPGFVRRAQVNWAAFTPSFLRTLSPSDLPTIKFITVHAEPMHGNLVKQWAGRIHMRPSYGPTECSVTSTVGAPFTPSSNAANIGWPIGCRGWVVDPNNHDVILPVGAVGELLIDGPIVGKGYLGDPEKTAASFIAPPVWSLDPELKLVDADPNRRLYKTGDLVRYTADGSLLILGRKDHSQVKVRGQRVEIQEIQHFLDESPQVLHNMLIMPNSGILRGRLVAALSLECLAAQHLPSQEEGHMNRIIRLVSRKLLTDELVNKVMQSLQQIQSNLSKLLPAYMMPEDWLVLEKMPVQVSHKLDRQSILKWVESIDETMLQTAQELQSHDAGAMVFGNDTEEAIREIWSQVLELPIARISLDTSFFRLGGDSIYAIQVMQRCKTHGLAVTTQDVLANPTIKQLAAIAATCQSTLSATALSSAAPAEASTTGRDIPPVDISLLPLPQDTVEHFGPCSPFQERIYRAFHDRAHRPYVFDTFIEVTEPPTEPSKLLETWNQVIERHGILRSTFVSAPGFDKIFQVVLKEHRVDTAVVPVTSEQDSRKQSERNLDTVRSRMFADNSPPLSLKVYVGPDKKTFMHLIINHILIDHVSFAHILSDWRCFYQGRQPSLSMPLPSFDGYISHIYAKRNTNTSNDFWKAALHGAGACLLVPPEDAQTPTTTSAPWEMGSVRFTVDMMPELEAFCQSEGITLSNLLQFSWALLLHLHTGKLDVVFGHLASDRDVDIPNAEAVVGPMLSVVVGRVQLQHSRSLLASLRELQGHNIRALSHKTYDMAHIEKQLGVQPGELFDTLVNIRKVKYHGDDSQDVGAFRSISKRDPHEQRVVLAFNESDTRLDAEITYRLGEMDHAKVQGLSETYCQILEGLSSGQLKTLEQVQSIGFGHNGVST